MAPGILRARHGVALRVSAGRIGAFSIPPLTPRATPESPPARSLDPTFDPGGLARSCAIHVPCLLNRADAVSVPAPHRPETTTLIRGRHFALMKEGAFFLNTARGEIVAEAEMVAVLQRRPDLFAMLDVTAPEPPPADSLLYSLPNVVLTPHLAGSVGPECARMGHAMVDEFERYCAGLPLKWEIDAERAAVLA